MVHDTNISVGCGETVVLLGHRKNEDSAQSRKCRSKLSHSLGKFHPLSQARTSAVFVYKQFWVGICSGAGYQSTRLGADN